MTPLIIILIVLAMLAIMFAADLSYPPLGLQRRLDGSTALPTGGILDIESGGSFRLAGTSVDASAAEINRVTKVSGRLVAAGATLTVTVAAHGDKIILLDTLAGSVVTLPAASGSGARFTFLVSVAPTSNFHQVKVASAADFIAGSVNILDNDAAAQGAFAADGAADDNIQLNGTTKGGLVGDWLEMVDLKTNVWAIRGMLVVPAGSNPADVFSAAV